MKIPVVSNALMGVEKGGGGGRSGTAAPGSKLGCIINILNLKKNQHSTNFKLLNRM
jgi:hypothetical protein